MSLCPWVEHIDNQRPPVISVQLLNLTITLPDKKQVDRHTKVQGCEVSPYRANGTWVTLLGPMGLDGPSSLARSQGWVVRG